MTSMPPVQRTLLLPNTGHAAGEPLWGAPPRRQPIVPLLVMAIVLLLVAAPAAMSGNGQSSNPIVLMHSIADTTYTVTGLMDESNEHLTRIDQNARPLRDLAISMVGISASSRGMGEKTEKLNIKLATVGGAVTTSKQTLQGVDGKLTTTAAGIGTLRGAVDSSLGSTRSIVTEFGLVDGSIGAMDATLKNVISLMAVSAPQTRAFAENKTRLSIAGGDGTKYGVPNITPGNRVMSVMLPMIRTMQTGGPLAARKDSAKGSILITPVLGLMVPDGTNVAATVLPYDGTYGLPPADYFVNNQVHGF